MAEAGENQGNVSKGRGDFDEKELERFGKYLSDNLLNLYGPPNVSALYSHIVVDSQLNPYCLKPNVGK